MSTDTSIVAAPTRERLLAAAGAVIEESGYGQATVAAIAARTELVPSALYRHFPSKEQLFVELFRTVCDREVRAMEQARGALGEGCSYVERVITVLSTFAERALRRPRLAWALLAEPVDPLVDAERLAYRQRYAALLSADVAAAVQAGEVPPQQPAITAAALVGACAEVLVGPLAPAADDGPAAGEVLRALRELIRRTLGART